MSSIRRSSLISSSFRSLPLSRRQDNASNAHLSLAFAHVRMARGRPVLSLEVEARASPLRQLQNSMGAWGCFRIYCARVTYALPASKALTSVKDYSSSSRLPGTDAERREDISHNDSSDFGHSAVSAEADLMSSLTRGSPSNVPVTSTHFGPLRIRYAIRHILEGRLGVRVRHAVRFSLRHILCNRLTCSLMCSCRNPSAVTFLYMCQTISFSK